MVSAHVLPEETTEAVEYLASPLAAIWTACLYHPKRRRKGNDLLPTWAL